MKTKQYNLVLFLITFLLIIQTSIAQAMPLKAITTKTLITNKAIAAWDSGIPLSDKRPVIVFLPGWGGAGSVNAYISAQNSNFINAGYVTLAIGFDSNATWSSDIHVKTKQGLDILCADINIPVNCDAILLIGSSYGGAQNYWVIEYIRNYGYDGVANTGNAIGFISEDAGYGAPGYITDNNTGAYTRTGLADTSSYSVAMIENLGDLTFPVDTCTWGNCGARILSDVHQTQGDLNVFSICPTGGSHGSRQYTSWNAWVMSAAKTIIHVTNGVNIFTGYITPTLTVSNECVTNPISTTFVDVPYNMFGWAQIESIYVAGITSGCSIIPLYYCPNGQVTRAQMAVFLLRGIHGSSYTPPAPSGSIFTDVPLNSFADEWIEQLANKGITGGCGGGNYCPNNSVTRAQMAVFLLRSKYGASYFPPVATGSMFTDVPISHPFASWIEQLANEGITGGCGGGNYCPDNSVTRSQMAIFIQRTFSLPLP